MAGGTFDKNVGKIRPGTYVNFKGAQNESMKTAQRGIVLLPLLHSDYGPEKEMIQITGESPNAAYDKLGYDVYEDDPAGNMLLIREALKNAQTVIVYLCAEGKTAAAATGGGLSAAAKYKGARGNALSFSIAANPVSGFDVEVYLAGNKVEAYEGIADAVPLAESQFISFAADGENALSPAAGVVLAGGESADAANADVAAFLEAADGVKFHTMACPFAEAELLAAVEQKVRYMRENEGKKVQAVVANMTSPDYEGIINVTNSYALDDLELTALQATAFVAGMTAGASYTESNTYRSVEGATKVIGAKSHEQAEAAIKAGEFFFFPMEENIVAVEYDINSLVTYTDGKSENYRKNRVLRVLDAFHDSLVQYFPPNKYDNNQTGWDIMDGIGKSVLKLYEDAGAITDVDYNNDFAVDRTLSTGDQTYFNVSIKPVDSAEKLYFTVTTR